MGDVTLIGSVPIIVTTQYDFPSMGSYHLFKVFISLYFFFFSFDFVTYFYLLPRVYFYPVQYPWVFSFTLINNYYYLLISLFSLLICNTGHPNTCCNE